MKPLAISKARAIAKEMAADGVAVFVFKGGRVAGTSYGASKAICGRMGRFIDRVVDDLGDGKIDNPLDDGSCPWPRITQDD
jgi:hypothetical protein